MSRATAPLRNTAFRAFLAANVMERSAAPTASAGSRPLPSSGMPVPLG